MFVYIYIYIYYASAPEIRRPPLRPVWATGLEAAYNSLPIYTYNNDEHSNDIKRLCVYIYIYMYIYIHTNDIYIYIYIYIHTHIQVITNNYIQNNAYISGTVVSMIL